jgi:hypothetical protein
MQFFANILILIANVYQSFVFLFSICKLVREIVTELVRISIFFDLAEVFYDFIDSVYSESTQSFTRPGCPDETSVDSYILIAEQSSSHLTHRVRRVSLPDCCSTHSLLFTLRSRWVSVLAFGDCTKFRKFWERYPPGLLCALGGSGK